MSRLASLAILIPKNFLTQVCASGVRSLKNISSSFAMLQDLDFCLSFHGIHAPAPLAFELHNPQVARISESEKLGVHRIAFRAGHGGSSLPCSVTWISQCSRVSNRQPQSKHAYFVMVVVWSSWRSSRIARRLSVWALEHSGHLVMSVPP
jgi:hypothetical protein